MSMWKMFRPKPSDKTPLLSDIEYDDSDASTPGSPSTSPLIPRLGQDSLSGALEMRRGSESPAWSDPLGGPSRNDDDEHLIMFRRAVGINSDDLSRSPAQSGTDSSVVGIYGSVIRQERRKRIIHHTLTGMVWGCHGIQIVLGATLTCLGLSTNEYPVTVTVLGAVNTVTASFLALVKGKGITEKMGRTEADFRQLKVWIEETEALLALGVIGGDRKEVGLLIETAFRRYNACFGRSFDIEAGIDRDMDALSAVDEERNGRDEQAL